MRGKDYIVDKSDPFFPRLTARDSFATMIVH